jgi:ABC-type methionine transport system ATPase subunit
MLITDRPVKMLDSITDGLDAATAYDIMRYLRDACSVLGHTYLIALHQAPSLIYELFDDVMILSEGRVIYQGDRTLAKTYFESLGFQCPVDVDEVEFLQEMATADGGARDMSLMKLHAFCDNNKVETAQVQEMDGDVDIVADKVSDYTSKKIAHSAFLAHAWQQSPLLSSMMTDINMELGSNCKPLVDTSATSSDQVKFGLQKSDRQEISLSTFDWPARCQVLPTIYDVTVRLWFCVTVTLSKY